MVSSAHLQNFQTARARKFTFEKPSGLWNMRRMLTWEQKEMEEREKKNFNFQLLPIGWCFNFLADPLRREAKIPVGYVGIALSFAGYLLSMDQQRR